MQSSWTYIMLNCPDQLSTATSFSSNMVFTGRMMSANRASFSNQGCCITMVSTRSQRSASCMAYPPFQHVVQLGESDMTMWIIGAPSTGNSKGRNWSSRGAVHTTCPCHVSFSPSGSVSACGVSVLGTKFWRPMVSIQPW